MSEFAEGYAVGQGQNNNCAYGYGGMGGWHARKIKEEMGEFAEVVGVYDINPERAKVAAEEGYIKPEDIQRLIAFRNNPSDESWINK
mgnify:CR=1 FL=1